MKALLAALLVLVMFIAIPVLVAIEMRREKRRWEAEEKAAQKEADDWLANELKGPFLKVEVTLKNGEGMVTLAVPGPAYEIEIFMGSYYVKKASKQSNARSVARTALETGIEVGNVFFPPTEIEKAEIKTIEVDNGARA